jgi:hypothetical protein
MCTDRVRTGGREIGAAEGMEHLEGIGRPSCNQQPRPCSVWRMRDVLFFSDKALYFCNRTWNIAFLLKGLELIITIVRQ